MNTAENKQYVKNSDLDKIRLACLATYRLQKILRYTQYDKGKRRQRPNFSWPFE